MHQEKPLTTYIHKEELWLKRKKRRRRGQMLRQVKNPHTGKTEWALVSKSKPGKVLEYFGTKRPSETRIERAEKRVQYYKNR
jgi:hypothetical protein